MEKTGSQIFIDLLKRHGVDTVFGYPGGAVLPIYDALFHSDLKHILSRHEQGAAHMAEGYAAATGKLGVVIATSGPGATNLVTGIANAMMDSNPILAFTGQVNSTSLGTDAFQEADIYGITIPITKYNALVRNVDQLAETIEEAILMATSHRPGPSLVDIPKDVQINKTNYTFPDKLTLPRHHYDKKPVKGDINALAEAINNAERPLICIGGGTVHSNSAKLIKELIDSAQIPVVMTLKGINGFPGTHPNSLGMVGMHGTRYANEAVRNCDLFISLGMRFDDRVTGDPNKFLSNAKIGHIDIDDTEINKIIRVDHPIEGDLKDVLEKLLTFIKPKKDSQWLKTTMEWKEKFKLRYNNDGDEIKPQYVIESINDYTKGNAIMVTDVGQHQMWAAQYFRPTQPRSFITSGGLGTMGFGFPASLGAKIGKPDREVVCITGDGSFQMTIQELATVRLFNIGVKIVIINNGYLGMVRQWQELFFGSRFSHTHIGEFNPDFSKLAIEGYGIPAMTISKKSELKKGLDFLFNTEGPALLNTIVPAEEKVYPMIPAGATYNDLMDYED